MDNYRGGTAGIGTEGNRRAKNPFKRRHETPVLLSVLRQAEGIQKFRSGLKPNDLALLPYGQRSQKDRNQAILPERQAKVRMSSNLKREMPVPAFEQQLAGRRSANRQATEYKRPRGKSEPLGGGFSLLPHKTDAISLLDLLLGDDELAKVSGKNLP